MGKNFTYVPGAEFPYQYRYEHMAVTTDCVIFTYEDRQLKVLLVRRGGEPYQGCWAFPGGFLQLNETADGVTTTANGPFTVTWADGGTLVRGYFEPAAASV